MNYVLGNWLRLDSDTSLSSYDNLGYEYEHDNNDNESKKVRFNDEIENDEKVGDIDFYKNKLKEVINENNELKEQLSMVNSSNLKKNSELSTDLIFQLQRNDMNELIIRSLKFSNFGLKIFGGASILLNFYFIYKRK